MGKFIKKMVALVTSLSSLGVVSAKDDKSMGNFNEVSILGYDRDKKKRKGESSSITRKVVYTAGGFACVLFIVKGICIAYDLLDGKGTRSLGSTSKENIDKLIGSSQKGNSVVGKDVNNDGFNFNFDYIKLDETKFGPLRNYIKDEFISGEISELHEELKKLENFEKDSENGSISSCEYVSSFRSSEENRNSLTSFERKLDKLVEEKDLPLKQFSIKDIDELYDELTKKDSGNSKETFVLKTGVDALRLYELASDGAIVQVASQFNALESVKNDFSPVKKWIDDHTQGPRASLQAVIASKHRESAYLKGELPDALEPIIKGFNSKPVSNSYKCGYLELFKIKDANVLKKFNDYIKEHIGDLGINAQWVMCANGRKQFQVFAAAPSFQGCAISKCRKECQKFLKDICNNLVVAQYKALAKIAVIKSILNGKQAEVHLTRVGQSSFGNPPEIMTNCLKEVGNIVKGRNVKVILHAHTKGSWNKNINKSGLKVEEYN